MKPASRQEACRHSRTDRRQCPRPIPDRGRHGRRHRRRAIPSSQKYRRRRGGRRACRWHRAPRKFARRRRPVCPAAACAPQTMIARATNTSAAPAQRRLEQTDQQQASGREQQRSGAERGDPAECAGQACDPERDHVHPFDAVTHLSPEHRVEAEGNGDNAENAHRHHPAGHDRHGEEIGEHAVRRHAVKVIGGVRRGGETGNKRSENEAQTFRGRPRAPPVRPAKSPAPARAQGMPRS